MKDYPKHIKDEAERRVNSAQTSKIYTHFDASWPSHRAIAELLEETGFKPPVDDFKTAFDIASSGISPKSFKILLAEENLTITRIDA